MLADATHAFGASNSHEILNDIINGFQNIVPPRLTTHVNDDNLYKVSSTCVPANEITLSPHGALEAATAEAGADDLASQLAAVSLELQQLKA